MRRMLLAVPVAIALVAAPAAHAGGWATVGLSSTPDGVAPGTPWNVDITVLQHGRTPLTGVQPVVRISSGDQRREFKAVPTGKPGVYRAAVVFPSKGRWSYEVDDGFISEFPHTFPAVQIGAGVAAPPRPVSRAVPTGGGGPSAGWLVPGVLLLLGAVGALVWDRARRVPARAPEPA